MNSFSTTELYRFYRDNLSYPALINGGNYKKQETKILCILLLPLLLLVVVGYFISFDVTILGSNRVINVLLFLVLLCAYFISLYLYFSKLDTMKDKWFAARDNPKNLSFYEFVDDLRKSEIQKYLRDRQTHTRQDVQRIIEKLEQERKRALNQVITLTALIGGAIAMLNDDLKILLVDGIEDTWWASFLYVLFVIACIFPIYQLLIRFQNLEYGKWPIYKQMIDVVKRIS